MPWYWTDDLTQTLVELGRLEEDSAGRECSTPIGIRRDEGTMKEAAVALQEEGEIPLAA